MPAVVIAAANRGTIPGRTSAYAAENSPRTALIVTLISGDGYFSWKNDTTTGETPLAVGVPIAFVGVDFSAPAYVYSPSGATVNYTEFPPR
jgi:hypothetical protein